MALTSNNCEMIKAIAENDFLRARKAAIASCIEDNSKKNEVFIKRYKNLLSNNVLSETQVSLPANLKGKLLVELPETFIKDRYYLSKREESIFNTIYKMRKVAEEFSSLNIKYPNTTLLYGESGTGKTLFGKYIAYRLQLPFFYINFSQMISSYMGSTADNLNKVFQYIRTFPCVFMIDEVDCISIKRGNGGSKGVDGELERTTISLMQELDQLPNTVILVAATNRKDLIDKALLRRFSIQHEITVLTYEENLELVDKFLSCFKDRVNIEEVEVKKVIEEKRTPASIINDLTLLIGNKLFDQLEDDVKISPWVDSSISKNNNVNSYEVVFSNVYYIKDAESSEDAVKKARILKLTDLDKNSVLKDNFSVRKL